MNSAIEIKNLQKSIRTGFFARKLTLLHDVSFQVPKGSVFGFVGPNGAGKSTTIKHLLGAIKPSSGSVTLLGASPRERSVRKQIGYLSELPQLPRTLSPSDMMSLHATLSKSDKSAAHIDSLLERVGLLRRKNDRISGFSKGMQQRLGIALALLNKPKLLIFDEPMSGLDPLGRRLVRNIIREAKKAGTTVFFSSHVVNDVESLCDEIALITKGRLVSSGTLREVLGHETRGVEIDFRSEHISDEINSLGALEKQADFWRLHTNLSLESAITKLKSAGASVDRAEVLRASLEERLDALASQDLASPQEGV